MKWNQRWKGGEKNETRREQKEKDPVIQKLTRSQDWRDFPFSAPTSESSDISFVCLAFSVLYLACCCLLSILPALPNSLSRRGRTKYGGSLQPSGVRNRSRGPSRKVSPWRMKSFSVVFKWELSGCCLVFFEVEPSSGPELGPALAVHSLSSSW